MDIASGEGISFHLRPNVAATDSHKRLSFNGSGIMRTEIGMPAKLAVGCLEGV
jgi:hypothetical protein